MSFSIAIRGFKNNSHELDLITGSSTFFVGANGSGKTRLAAEAEKQLGERAHRISAHRALSLNPTVAKINEKQARSALRFGNQKADTSNAMIYRNHDRWGKSEETFLLNDFDHLVQVLFAEQSNVALKTHYDAHSGDLDKPALTKFQKLISIWERILPHRKLIVTGDDITAVEDGQEPYNAAQMSDGERSVFYMLGQILVAEPNSALIFDEPELHIHRAILGRLWDEVEGARPDCAFMVITHDLEFAASRPGSKYAIRRYQSPGKWEIEHVPEDTGFDEEVTTLILGSRKPILFVEGTGSSLDVAIYRACYPNWTVLPRGACEDVIHAVATMRKNAILTRVTCTGIVDADDYSEEDKENLARFGVSTLPVSEIENLFLLPVVSAAILTDEKYQGRDLVEKLATLKSDFLDEVKKSGAIDDVVLRYCRRRIDRTLKKIDLADAKTPEDLAELFRQRTEALNVAEIAKMARDRIEKAVAEGDLPALLANFDSKALLALAAKHTKGISKTNFESWLSRALRDPEASKLKVALQSVLPTISAS